MGSRKRAKLAFDAFRSCMVKITANPPFQESSSSRVYLYGYSIRDSNPAKFSSAFSSSVSRGLGFGCQTGMNNRIHYINPHIVGGGAKRFYCADGHGVQHFSRRRLFENGRDILIALMAASGLFIIVFVTFYFNNLETVPYTKRKHFVPVPEQTARQMSEIWFQQRKARLKRLTLPATHPESVRVLLIAKSIIEGLHRDLGLEQVCTVVGYGSAAEIDLSHEGDGKIEIKKHDEIVDDKWIQQSRKKGKETGSRPKTSHLDGLKWEVMVVDHPVSNATSSSSGKIVVFTGLLELFGSDEEIATMLGHEIAHVVARHHAELLSNNIWLAKLPDVIKSKLTVFFRRRIEAEADYIGMMLVASAGYDPRLVPQFYEKLGKLDIETNSPLADPTRDDIPYPPGIMRAKLLSQAQVMEEALRIYRETVAAGRGIRNDNWSDLQEALRIYRETVAAGVRSCKWSDLEEALRIYREIRAGRGIRNDNGSGSGPTQPL